MKTTLEAPFENKKRLSERDRAILFLTQLRANESISNFKDLLDISEHQLRRAISKFKYAGLWKPLPIVNLSAIGFSRYQILFSVTRKAQENLKVFQQKLINHPAVYFFCEVGGNYQYMIGLQIRNLRGLQDFLDEFALQFEGCFSESEILPVVEMTFLGTGMLAPSLPRAEPVGWCEKSASIELDEVSEKILHTYCNSDISSPTELSRKAEIPKSTVHFRLEQLAKHGVIAGYFNSFDPVNLGMFPFNILISFRGVTREREHKLRILASQRREVDTFVKNIGSWDFTLICFVEDARSVAPVVESLRAEFGNDLDKVSVLPQFHTFKWVEYSSGRGIHGG